MRYKIGDVELVDTRFSDLRFENGLDFGEGRKLQLFRAFMRNELIFIGCLCCHGSSLRDLQF